jgi:hypothetical protein
MAVSGHMSRRILEHYSHVRMAAKRAVLDKLESGLMGGLPVGGRAGTRTPDLLRVKNVVWSFGPVILFSSV